MRYCILYRQLATDGGPGVGGGGVVSEWTNGSCTEIGGNGITGKMMKAVLLSFPRIRMIVNLLEGLSWYETRIRCFMCVEVCIVMMVKCSRKRH
jgi:hypothetical protein